MKKLAISLFCVLGLVATSCDDDRTLDDTRLQETEKPTLTLNEVTMEDSYTVTMSATLNTVGDPNVFEFGFIISPEENPTVENSTYIVADSVAANMTLEKTISIYTGGKLNARAYALTTAGITYSETTSLDMKRHPLYDWQGNYTANGGNLFLGEYEEFPMVATIDSADETKLSLSGFMSQQIDGMPLAPLDIYVDTESGTGVIKANTIINEPNYGDYMWVYTDASGKPYGGDIPVYLSNGEIYIEGLGALGMNGALSGYFHTAYIDLSIVKD